MSDDARKPFLSRWSQRKLAAAREGGARPANEVVAPVAAVPVETAAPSLAQPGVDPVAPELPPVDSLSFDSDFTQFMQPKVNEALKRQALRKLFSDPRFNVMDGLDVYIDDYTKFEPMTPELVAQLNHAKFLFDPPKTRINAQGYAEDVPREPVEVGEAQPDDAAAPTANVDGQGQCDKPAGAATPIDAPSCDVQGIGLASEMRRSALPSDMLAGALESEEPHAAAITNSAGPRS